MSDVRCQTTDNGTQTRFLTFIDLRRSFPLGGAVLLICPLSSDL
jgi:hypothetical protein